MSVALIPFYESYHHLMESGRSSLPAGGGRPAQRKRSGKGRFNIEGPPSLQPLSR